MQERTLILDVIPLSLLEDSTLFPLFPDRDSICFWGRRRVPLCSRVLRCYNCSHLPFADLSHFAGQTGALPSLAFFSCMRSFYHSFPYSSPFGHREITSDQIESMTSTRCIAPNVVLEAIQSSVCASRQNLTAPELSRPYSHPRQRAPFSCQNGTLGSGTRSREIGSPAGRQDASRQLEDFSEMTLGPPRGTELALALASSGCDIFLQFLILFF